MKLLKIIIYSAIFLISLGFVNRVHAATEFTSIVDPGPVKSLRSHGVNNATGFKFGLKNKKSAFNGFFGVHQQGAD